MRSSSRCCSAIVHPRYCCFLVTPSCRAKRKQASRELPVIVASVVTRSLKLPGRAALSSSTARGLSLSLNSITSCRASFGQRRWRLSSWCFGSSIRNKATRSDCDPHLPRYKSCGRRSKLGVAPLHIESLYGGGLSQATTRFCLIVEFCSRVLRRFGKLVARAWNDENLLMRNWRDIGVTRSPRIDLAQAMVPASCEKKRVDQLGAFLAQPVFARYQRQLTETLL
jgi:hypothetical protein